MLWSLYSAHRSKVRLVGRSVRVAGPAGGARGAAGERRAPRRAGRRRDRQAAGRHAAAQQVSDRSMAAVANHSQRYYCPRKNKSGISIEVKSEKINVM